MKSMVEGCVQKACNVLPFGSSSEKAYQEDAILRDIIASHSVSQFLLDGLLWLLKC